MFGRRQKSDCGGGSQSLHFGALKGQTTRTFPRTMYLYETHLPVTSTEASAKFYVDIVGLESAYHDRWLCIAA